MDDKVSDQLTEIQAFIQQGLETGVDFASAQVPLLIQEILNWGIAYAITWWVLMLIPIGLVLYVRTHLKDCQKNYKLKVKDGGRASDSEECANVFRGYILPIAAATILFISTAVNGLEIIKILVAPRLYLLEQVSNLIG